MFLFDCYKYLDQDFCKLSKGSVPKNKSAHARKVINPMVSAQI